MHEPPTKAATKREVQAVMATKNHTSAFAVPRMKPDHRAYTVFATNQRAWLDEMLQVSKKRQIGKLIIKALGGVPQYMPDPMVDHTT